MGRATSNRTSNTLFNLALTAFYLNMTVKTANGSEYYAVGPMLPLAMPPVALPAPWPEIAASGAKQGYQGYADAGKNVGGYSTNNGYYDDLLANKNGYDVGKTFGNGYDYSKGSIVGGGFRDLDGRNKGHKAAGFSTSYRKDESGDKATYYDDGLGHNARINYAAHDARFRDQGGAANRGGLHDTNLNRNAIGKSGSYGDQMAYRGYAGEASGGSGGSSYGVSRGNGYGHSHPPTNYGGGYSSSFGGGGYQKGGFGGYGGANSLGSGYYGGYGGKGYGTGYSDSGYGGGNSGYGGKGYGGYSGTGYGTGYGGKGYGGYGSSYAGKGYDGYGSGSGSTHGGAYGGYGTGYGYNYPTGYGDTGSTYSSGGYRYPRYSPSTYSNDTLKNTGVYVIPLPDKVYFDKAISSVQV